MDAPVSMIYQPCSHGCSSVSDTVNPVAMDAPVWGTLSTLQPWMLQCQWHCQPCSYGCSSVSDTVNPAAMDAPLSVTLSTLQLWMFHTMQLWMPQCQPLSALQLWMLQCQSLSALQPLMLQCHRHWSIHCCRVEIGASIYPQDWVDGLHDYMIKTILQLWMLQCQWHWSIHSCRVDSDTHH